MYLAYPSNYWFNCVNSHQIYERNYRSDKIENSTLIFNEIDDEYVNNAIK